MFVNWTWPYGTPPIPLPENKEPEITVPRKCTCDINVLMTSGCKCGWIAIERQHANATEDLISDWEYL